jgi:Family of unknown function (DUF5681)
MPDNLLQKQVERTRDGHFVKSQSGNPAGRTPGCRNQATRTAEALLDGEVAALTRKAVALALDGDVTAMRLCLERVIAPRRGRPVQLDLPPITKVADITDTMAALTAAVAAGDITPGEAVEVAKVVDLYVRAIEAVDFDRRLKMLEDGDAAISDTRLARVARTRVPRDLAEPRRRALLRARVALAGLLRERPPSDAGQTLPWVLQCGEAAAAELAEIPDTALLRAADERRLAADHAGVEDAFAAKLLHLILQYRDGREIDPVNASPAELLAARLAGATDGSAPTQAPPPSPPPQAGEG